MFMGEAGKGFVLAQSLAGVVSGWSPRTSAFLAVSFAEPACAAAIGFSQNSINLYGSSFDVNLLYLNLSFAGGVCTLRFNVTGPDAPLFNPMSSRTLTVYPHSMISESVLSFFPHFSSRVFLAFLSFLLLS
jgi:hypothetical protein